ncbi:MAG: AI-2E family transporter [Pyrinomonadaceae bacterium]
MTESENVNLNDSKAAEPPHQTRVFLDPSSPPVLSIIRVVVIVLLVVFVANRIESLLGALTFLAFLVVISVFLAYLLDPLVRLIRRPFRETKYDKLMPRSFAILISYIVVGLVFGIFILNVTPPVVEQGKEFGSRLPTYAAGIRQTFNDLNYRYDRLRIPEEVQTRLNEQAITFGEKITTGFGNFVLSSITFLPWLIIVPIFSFFFLKDANSFRLAVLRLFPVGRWRIRAESVMQDVNSTLAAYTRAQLFSCFLIGIICTIGFYLIGLKFALLLGILAGIFEFVPLIGPLTLGLIAVTTAAFSDDPWRAVYTMVFLIVLRVIHDYVTYPRIVRGGIHLHPVVIILSVLAGEQAAGIPGVFISIPIVAIGTVIYRNLTEHLGGRGLFATLVDAENPVIEETE